MDNRTLKIFIACASGAGIGSLIALEMGKYLWWIGLLVGGFTGYLSYESKKVVEASKKAMQSVRKTEFPKFSIANIRKYGKAIGAVLLACFILAVIGFVLLMHIAVFGIFFPNIIKQTPVELLYSLSDNISLSAVMLTLVGLVCFMVAALLMYEILGVDDDRKNEALVIALAAIPIFVISLSIVYLVCKVAKFIPGFVWKLFILIHSDIRLLCGIDAAIGAGVGYFSGSVVVGMLVGGVFGVINYEVVSKRWLKLEPVKD